MKLLLTVSAWLALIMLPLSTMAQTSAEGTDLVPPDPIDIAPPIFPASALGDEAWVQLNFTVKADGSTADFAATDDFGRDTFKDAAMAAARGWKFRPGQANGKPTDWQNYTYDVFFAYPNAVAGGYPGFATLQDTVSKLLLDKKFADAKAAIEAAQANHSVRLLFEYASLETLLYTAESGLGNSLAAYRAIARATPDVRINRRPQGPDIGTRLKTKVQLAPTAILPDMVLKSALRTRFAAEAKLGLYGDALATYERIDALEKITPADPLVGQRRLINDAIASDQPLGVSARIEDGSWLNRPVRRKFGFAQVKGSIDKIKLACNRHGAELPYKDGSQWEMPAEWGDCTIEVVGADGTQFVFVQTGAAIAARAVRQAPTVVLAPDKPYETPIQVAPNRPGN